MSWINFFCAHCESELFLKGFHSDKPYCMVCESWLEDCEVKKVVEA